MNKKNLEIRSFGLLRALDGEDSRLVKGLAIPVESKSQLLGGTFYEIIRSTAVNQELIDSQDVMLIMNHDESMGVLGRSKNGKGTLKLSVTERGLEFECELPNTDAGNSILEGVKRGDFDAISFAFWPEEDEWTENEDGTYTRSILKIGYLREISILSVAPAYEATDVALRSLEEFKELRAKEDEEPKDEEPKDTEPKDEKKEEKKEADDEKEKEDKKDEEEEEKSADEEDKKEDEEKKNCDDEDKEKRNTNTNTNLSNIRKMKKNKFSIANVLRSKINGTKLDKTSEAVLRAAQMANDEAGLNTSGFAIPFDLRDLSIDDDVELREDPAPADNSLGNPVTGNELNATLTDANGKDTIHDEYMSLIDPIFNASVLGEFTHLTGLKGNIVFPRHNGVACAWEDELAVAEESTMKFDGVKMSPKRLTSYVTISKQLLTQSDYNIEAIVRQELINSIGRKLQATLFGTQQGSTSTPQGLFYGIDSTQTANKVPATYAGLVAVEEAAEENNVGGELKYVIKPSIKATYRTTLKSNGVSGYIFEGNEVLGVPTVVTNDCPGLIYGNLKDVVIAQWGNIDIVVDTITLAAYGAIRLVINTYWDIKPIFPVTGEGSTKTEVPTIICKLGE